MVVFAHLQPCIKEPCHKKKGEKTHQQVDWCMFHECFRSLCLREFIAFAYEGPYVYSIMDKTKYLIIFHSKVGFELTLVLKSLGCDYFELKTLIQSQFGAHLKACGEFVLFFDGLQRHNIGGTLPLLYFADDGKSKSFSTFQKNGRFFINMKNERYNSFAYV